MANIILLINDLFFWSYRFLVLPKWCHSWIFYKTCWPLKRFTLKTGKICIGICLLMWLKWFLILFYFKFHVSSYVEWNQVLNANIFQRKDVETNRQLGPSVCPCLWVEPSSGLCGDSRYGTGQPSGSCQQRPSVHPVLPIQVTDS